MIVIWIFYQILMKNLNKIIISIRVALGYKKNALVLNWDIGQSIKMIFIIYF